MYGEDADLAARARSRGYHPAITPDAVILHHVRSVLALGGQARDEPPLPRRARPQALVARRARRRRGAPAGGNGRACARCRSHPPPVVDVARRLATAPGLARRLRLRRRRSLRRPVMTSAGASPGRRASVPPMASPESRGVAAGRFAPFHRGHQHLIERARGLVDSLDVVVVHEPDDVLAPELRTGWIRDAFAEHPQVQVHAVRPATTPPKPCVSPGFRAGHLLHRQGPRWLERGARAAARRDRAAARHRERCRAGRCAGRAGSAPGRHAGIRRAARVRARRREHGQDDARARPRRRAGHGVGARVRARLHRDAARPPALRLDDARLRDHLEAPELERGSRRALRQSAS